MDAKVIPFSVSLVLRGRNAVVTSTPYFVLRTSHSYGSFLVVVLAKIKLEVFREIRAAGEMKCTAFDGVPSHSDRVISFTHLLGVGLTLHGTARKGNCCSFYPRKFLLHPETSTLYTDDLFPHLLAWSLNFFTLNNPLILFLSKYLLRRFSI